jgi:ketosteroid isomerase-like protein
MSEENVEIVRRSADAFQRRDFPAVIECFDPDVEYDMRIRPDGRICRGMDEVQKAFRTWLGTWDDYSINFEEVIDAGDNVVAVFTEAGRGKGSGMNIEQRLATVHTVRDGKIVSVRIFRSKAEALEAAGLPEGDARSSSPEPPLGASS